MPRVEMDFENVGKPFEGGMYRAEIIGAQTKPAKNGSTNIEWQWQIIEPGQAMGRKLLYWSHLAEAKMNPDGTPDKEARERAAYYLKKFLTTLGAPFDPKSFDTESVLHRQAILKVSVQMVNGEERNQIDEVLPLPTE